MDFGIRGRTAMVAAASKGIGFAVAKELLSEGCRVSICSRSSEGLTAAVQKLGGDAVGTVCDVSKRDQIEGWFRFTDERVGKPDILVTNTGGPPAGAASSITDEQWLLGFENTLLNIVRMVRLASPAMADKKWGRIVHITSLVAAEPNPLLPISSTLRSGIGALTHLQSLELAPHGVTVNAVLPGHTLTDRQRHLAQIRAEKQSISMEEALELQASEVPTKRLAEPEEIAAAVAFLCSARASYVNGTSLLVDGGSVKGIT